MPVVLLVAYFVALALGIVMLALSLLTYEKLQNKVFRDASIAVLAAILLGIVDGTRSFYRLTSGVLGSPSLVFTVGLTVAGNGLLAYAVPTLAFRLVNVHESFLQKICHISFIALLIAVGWLRVALGGPLISILNLVGFAALHAYGATVILFFFSRVADPMLRTVLRSFLVLLAVIFVLFAVQPFILSRLPISPEMREEPWMQLLFQICMGCFFLFYAVRYFYRPTPVAGFSLPPGFVSRYGISHRECEIISLVVQGFSHKQIGEKLFISSRTVKNHIYNIYQKTGVENKVQLLNLVQVNSTI